MHVIWYTSFLQRFSFFKNNTVAENKTTSTFPWRYYYVIALSNCITDVKFHWRCAISIRLSSWSLTRKESLLPSLSGTAWRSTHDFVHDFLVSHKVGNIGLKDFFKWNFSRGKKAAFTGIRSGNLLCLRLSRTYWAIEDCVSCGISKPLKCRILLFCIFTARKWSCGKVMFLQASVVHREEGRYIICIMR